MNNSVFVVHIFSSFFMTGLIWLVQLLHYPSYKYINSDQFTAYQTFHTQTITFIVGPMMVAEIFSGLYLMMQMNWEKIYLVNFVLLMIIWLATAILSVPNHGKLALGYDLGVVDYLIRTNWIRTLAWTIHSGILVYLLLKTLNKETL